MSDSLPLDRVQRDVRRPRCKEKHVAYPHGRLPTATVVIVFHNECFSILVRSVHSVLNLTPPRLLKEVILVDDASTPDPDRFYEKHWLRLQDELASYCRQLPKVRLLRLKRRRGLMLARMEGAWRARGDVLVFLDSHIEATPGWAEPLLARILEDRRHVVVPSIDSIDNFKFEYDLGGGLSILGFSWTLGQVPLPAKYNDGAEIEPSPVMAGGLFAADKEYFLHLGGYDPEMKLYGGEEMEIGFRTWQCGGDIEYVPCSHVGHVFRTPTHWKGQVYRVPGEEISRNKLRAAEVWMDEFKDLVYLATPNLPQGMSVEPLAQRKMLREKLGCRSFAWYIKNVYPAIFAPKLGAGTRIGSVGAKSPHGCLDTLNGVHDGDEVGVYPCHGQHGTQAIVMDEENFIRFATAGFAHCLAYTSRFHLSTCSGSAARWRWEMDSGGGRLRQWDAAAEEGCLGVKPGGSGAKSPLDLVIEPCRRGDSAQAWSWTQ